MENNFFRDKFVETTVQVIYDASPFGRVGNEDENFRKSLTLNTRQREGLEIKKWWWHILLLKMFKILS